MVVDCINSSSLWRWRDKEHLSGIRCRARRRALALRQIHKRLGKQSKGFAHKIRAFHIQKKCCKSTTIHSFLAHFFVLLGLIFIHTWYLSWERTFFRPIFGCVSVKKKNITRRPAILWWKPFFHRWCSVCSPGPYCKFPRLKCLKWRIYYRFCEVLVPVGCQLRGDENTSWVVRLFLPTSVPGGMVGESRPC